MNHQITDADIPVEIEHVICMASGTTGSKTMASYVNTNSGEVGYVVTHRITSNRFFFPLNCRDIAIEKYNSL